jgi:outer membrane receptor protein involved in Fe transport
MRVLSYLLLVIYAQAMGLRHIHILDPQGRPVAGASVTVGDRKLVSNEQGDVEFEAEAGTCAITIEAAAFQSVTRQVTLGEAPVELRFEKVASRRESMVVSANAERTTDFRTAIFTRDDQVFQQLDSGIDAGQHEGGGKSLEIRRFGFNLDHGGVNGGLKVLVDDVQQNQGTQGHGQGYLGSLKSVSPELIQDVTVIDGPFSAEYGDFSGLGVVHIRQRESMPDVLTLRAEGGQFGTARGFAAFSPDLPGIDSYVAYEGSYTDGPFVDPLRYRRDNLHTNLTKHLKADQTIGLRLMAARNDFYSSGQIPLDLVSEGLLDRLGYVDRTDGGRVRMATTSAYYSRGSTFRVDGFVSRSLFDLYSNFTYYLNDPARGDAFQQHDSRLQQGFNTHYTRTHKLGVLVAGTNFHDNQINVGLYPRDGRVPLGVTTRALAHVTNAAGFAQETVSLWRGRLLLSSGLRFDGFRYGVRDVVTLEQSGTQWAGRWQGKGSATLRPWKAPVGLHVNYGRGINSIDARGVVQRPEQPRLATTDFYQAGMSASVGRLSLSADTFLIRHSNEMVYIPDDGSFEFKGPSQAYGYEAKASLPLTRHLSLNAGVTKMLNAYYLGGDHRVYVDSAPHFVANAALTMAGWRGWSGSLRMRAINHYRLDGDDPSIAASGHTVFDLGVARQLRRGVELNLSVNNALDRSYYETQNYFVSQVTPVAPAVARIHGTPGYPLTAVAGITFRLRGK